MGNKRRRLKESWDDVKIGQDGRLIGMLTDGLINSLWDDNKVTPPKHGIAMVNTRDMYSRTKKH